jgi:hypothetical protein
VSNPDLEDEKFDYLPNKNSSTQGKMPIKVAFPLQLHSCAAHHTVSLLQSSGGVVERRSHHIGATSPHLRHKEVI